MTLPCRQAHFAVAADLSGAAAAWFGAPKGKVCCCRSFFPYKAEGHVTNSGFLGENRRLQQQ